MGRRNLDNTEISGGVIFGKKFIPKKNLSSGTLRIVLTSKCNFNCRYCFNEGEDKFPRELDLNVIKRVVKNGLLFGIKSIKLTGGEPLLYSRLDKLLKFLRDSGINYIDLTTNISLLDISKISLLNKYRVNAVTLSLDSFNKDRFQKLTNSSSYPQVVSNLNNVLKRFKGHKRINCVVTDKDISDYLEIIDYCLNKKVGLRLCEPTTVAGKEITKDKRGFEKVLRYLRNNCSKFVRSECTSVEYYFFGKQYITVMKSLCDNKLCENCKDYMYLRLTSDGKLRPCLARTDNLVDVNNSSDDETKKAFTLAINQMGIGIY